MPLKGDNILRIPLNRAYRAGTLMQWLKRHAWKVERLRFKPALAFKLQRNTMFLLCSLVMNQYCGEHRAQSQTAGFGCRILCLEQGIAMYNVSLWSGEQCHLIHPSILLKFFWPSLAYICANRWHKISFSFHLLEI